MGIDVGTGLLVMRLHQHKSVIKRRRIAKGYVAKTSGFIPDGMPLDSDAPDVKREKNKKEAILVLPLTLFNQWVSSIAHGTTDFGLGF